APAAAVERTIITPRPLLAIGLFRTAVASRKRQKRTAAPTSGGIQMGRRSPACDRSRIRCYFIRLSIGGGPDTRRHPKSTPWVSALLPGGVLVPVPLRCRSRR